MIKFFLFFLCFYLGYAQEHKKLLKVAPLPTNSSSQVVEEIVPFFNHIDSSLGFKTKIIYEKEYDKIIENFKNNQIDLAILGPLPYLKLRQISHNSEAIIIFKNEKSHAYFRCVLAKFKSDTVDLTKSLKIALTQPLSTCGYFITEQLLKNRYNIELKDQQYTYKMSHSEAIVSVLEGEFDLAGARGSIVEEFGSLGVEVLVQSEFLPEFALVANTQTLTKEQILEIKNTILSIPQSTYKQWKGLVSNGFINADKLVYEKLQVDFEKIPLTGNTQ